MKILYVSSHKRDDPSGGAAVAWELAEEMAGLYETAILGPGEINGFRREPSGLGVYSVESIGNNHFNVNFLTRKNIKKITAFLDEFKPDVIHTHTPIDLGLIAQVWAIKNEVPFFCTVHLMPTKIGTWSEVSYLGEITSKISEFATEQFILPFFENCTEIIALNNAVEDDLRKFGYEGPISRIPNGRKLKRYTTLRYADPRKKPIKLLYIGSIMPRKNQLYLAEVMSQLPDYYELHLAGSVQDPMYQRKIESYMKGKKLENLFFHGRVEHEQIPTHLEGTSVFVSASKAEAQALVIIEAMASGTPVVGLANATVEEFVNEKNGVKLPLNSSPEYFAREVDRIVELPEGEYQALCKNARERTRDHDWSVVARKTVKCYQNDRPKMRKETILSRFRSIFPIVRNESVREYVKATLEKTGITVPEVNIADRIEKREPRVPVKTSAILALTGALSVGAFLGWKYWKSVQRRRDRADSG